jgi:chemotaxis protein MotA
VDLASVGGLLFAIITIAVGAYFEHVTLESVLGLSAFLIVVGGSVGVTALSHTTSELKTLPGAIKSIFSPKKIDYSGMVDYLVNLADLARRKGLLSLQDEAENAANPLVQRGLTMVVDGADPEKVSEVLDTMLEMEEEHGLHASHVFNTAGGYAPTLGIMGTVMAMVMVMDNLDQPETLGPAIAVAFLAALYGVGVANIIFLPFGSKVKHMVKEQSKFNTLIVEGIIGVQSGENPRNLREKLTILAGLGVQTSAKKAAGVQGRAVEEGA